MVRKSQFLHHPTDLFGFKQTLLNGKEISMDTFKGKKAFLIVNVASKSDNSDDEYKWLADMKKKYPELVIITYPCNQFCYSEPGTDEEISEF